MSDYTIGDWILAGWTMDELARKALKEGWTARQVIDDCIDHAADDAQLEGVRALPGDDELEAMIAERMTAIATPLRDLSLAAGYVDRIDITRLLADLHRQPMCDRVQRRTLQNYLAGRSVPRGFVAIGLARVLGCDVTKIVGVD